MVFDEESHEVISLEEFKKRILARAGNVPEVLGHSDLAGKRKADEDEDDEGKEQGEKRVRI
jgi:hypothetical protein